MNTAEGVLSFFEPCHKFIDESLEKGQNVMVHCMAGAHRAGAAGVSYMMKAGRISFEEALKTARACRGVIDPFGDLAELLTRLQAAYTYFGFSKNYGFEPKYEHIVGFEIDQDLGKLCFYFNSVK